MNGKGNAGGEHDIFKCEMAEGNMRIRAQREKTLPS